MYMSIDQEQNAAQVCPSVFLDDFYYTATDTNNNMYCGANSHWETCQDTTQMTFNYTACNHEIAYSGISTFQLVIYIWKSCFIN